MGYYIQLEFFFSCVHLCILTNREAPTIPLSTASHCQYSCFSLGCAPENTEKAGGVFCTGGIKSLTPTPSVRQVVAEEHAIHPWKVWGSMDD